MEENKINDINENYENIDVEKAPSALVYKLEIPVMYGEKEYTELHIDFTKLRGKDARAISAELQALGKAVLLPSYSDEYLTRMVVRAAEEKIGDDFFDKLTMHDYNKLISRARTFLLKSESPIPTAAKG
ncbi:MAG: hypothetical protein IKJ91_00140 [Clostridia bacterium]|nr:hypothetical protein [Clostridia bacterium]